MEENYKVWFESEKQWDYKEESSSKKVTLEDEKINDGMIEIRVNDQDGYAFTYSARHIPHVGENIMRDVGWNSCHYIVNKVYHIINDGDNLVKVELNCTKGQETY